MLKTKKTILAAILCFAMVLCLTLGAVLQMPKKAFAEGFTLEDYKYDTNYYLGGSAHMEEIGDGEFAFVGKLPASGVEIKGLIPLNPGFHEFSKNFSWTGDSNVTLVGSPVEGDDVTFVYKVISIEKATLTVTKGKLIYSWDTLNTAIALTPGTLAAPATEATTIKLTWDLTQPADSIKPINIPMGKNIILDLNGRVLNANGEDSVIHLGSNGPGTLTVIDSTPTTEHKGYIDQNGLWHWDEKGEHELLTGETSKAIKGGIITGGSEDYNGGGVSVGGAGTFNMYGGTICGNKPEDGGNSGAVRVTNIFNMYGGAICSNTLSGVRIEGGGIFNMYGGTICDNRTTNGGGVAILPYNGSIATFNMLGGTIRGNRVSGSGGGIYNWYNGGKSGKLTLGGTAVVSGNFKGDEANDVQQDDYHDCDFNISTDTPPENGMMVGLYSQDIKVKEASETDTKYFFSDSADYYVNFNNNNTPDTSDDYLELKPVGTAKAVRIPTVSGGVVYTDKQVVEASAAGDARIVTLTVIPDEGYQLKSLTVSYNDGEDKTITPEQDEQDNKKYTFEMPAANVTVTAEFELAYVHAIKTTYAKVEAKCEEAGHEAYYECDCGKYFSDQSLTQQIENLETWLGENGDGYIAPIGHNVNKVDEVSPTKKSVGTKEYYKCSNCELCFEDEECTILIDNIEEWKATDGYIEKRSSNNHPSVKDCGIHWALIVLLVIYVALNVIWYLLSKFSSNVSAIFVTLIFALINLPFVFIPHCILCTIFIILNYLLAILMLLFWLVGALFLERDEDSWGFDDVIDDLKIKLKLAKRELIKIKAKLSKNTSEADKEKIKALNEELKDEDNSISQKEMFRIARGLSKVESKDFSKKSVIDYLNKSFNEEVEINSRPNQIAKGFLPLADTHYTLMKQVDGKLEKVAHSCFAYVYEFDNGRISLLTKIPTKYADDLAKKHENVKLSKFPNSKKPWYSIIIDDSWTTKDLFDCLNKAKEYSELPIETETLTKENKSKSSKNKVEKDSKVE